jgi:hypothetical protein
MLTGSDVARMLGMRQDGIVEDGIKKYSGRIAVLSFVKINRRYCGAWNTQIRLF